MVSLQEHIDFLRKLRFPYKPTLTRYFYQLFKDHASEIPDIDTFIKEIMKEEYYAP